MTNKAIVLTVIIATIAIVVTVLGLFFTGMKMLLNYQESWPIQNPRNTTISNAQEMAGFKFQIPSALPEGCEYYYWEYNGDVDEDYKNRVCCIYLRDHVCIYLVIDNKYPWRQRLYNLEEYDTFQIKEFDGQKVLVGYLEADPSRNITMWRKDNVSYKIYDVMHYDGFLETIVPSMEDIDDIDNLDALYPALE